MLQGYTMAIIPCGNPTPKKLPTGGGEWPTFRTARAQRTVRPHRHTNVDQLDSAQISTNKHDSGLPVFQQTSSKLIHISAHGT